MAERAGADPKTVHRAYLAMERDGLLEMRPGSGSFLKEGRTSGQRPMSASQLLASANRSRAEAAALGLDLRAFARFLALAAPGGLSGVSLAVAECNLEQVALFSLELQSMLGVRCRHVLLPGIGAEADKTLAGCRGIVTTDFHRREVDGIATRAALPVYRISLDPRFTRALVDEAGKGPVVMVVRDRSFAPGFFRFLLAAAVPENAVARMHVVEPREMRTAFRKAGRDAAIYVSPTVARELPGPVPAGLRRISVARHVSAASLERLRVRLALDLAVRGTTARSSLTSPRG
jgi:hypothetical protein